MSLGQATTLTFNRRQFVISQSVSQKVSFEALEQRLSEKKRMLIINRHRLGGPNLVLGQVLF